jgi:7-keto-8-aminopelargonate synthetase-like enzyme
VPEGASRLRLSLSYGHTPEMIARLVAALVQLKGR